MAARGQRAQRSRRRLGMAAAVVLLVATAAACSPDRAEPTSEPTTSGEVVVGSFNFDESRLLAEIYAQALEDEGVAVRRELDLGPRELVLPALQQGLVDVVPEYLGALADAALPVRDPTGTPTDPGLVDTALAPVLARWGTELLDPSPASNQNALVVTRELAEELHLRSTSDLAAIARPLTLGGPPECRTRPRCLPGLERAYSLRFADFLPFGATDLVRQALADGVIDVGVMFTTDGILAEDDLVVLTDDRSLQPAENLVPVVRTAAVDRRARAALDEVSSALTTSELRFLNWRVSVAGRPPAAEARGWLVRRGLIARQPPSQAAAAAASS